jgi:thymidylate synthase
LSESHYLNLLHHCLHSGERRPDRTGTGTRSLFGGQIEWDLTLGKLPVITTKKIHLKSVVVELLWMLKGHTTLDYLHKHGVTIWDEWAVERGEARGELGPIYGHQWRNLMVDQIAEAQRLIVEDPMSRRIVVSAWNPADLHLMALSPCHCLFQFYVSTDGYLDCHLYQRSADVFLGVPFNITSYSLLTHLMAAVTGLKPRAFLHSFGDVHLYENHVDQACEQLTRPLFSAPLINLKRIPENVWEFEPEDIEITHYFANPALPAKVAV